VKIAPRVNVIGQVSPVASSVVTSYLIPVIVGSIRARFFLWTILCALVAMLENQ
jgi:hypothetical protein